MTSARDAGVRNAEGTFVSQDPDMGAVNYGSFLVRAWERDGSFRVVIEAVQSGRRTELRDGPARAVLDSLRGELGDDHSTHREPVNHENGPLVGRRGRPPRERTGDGR